MKYVYCIGNSEKHDLDREVLENTASQRSRCSFTPLAVGACGELYRKKRQSNLSPGEGDSRKGCMYASTLMLDRIIIT